jgi:hypothetical protein
MPSERVLHLPYIRVDFKKRPDRREVSAKVAVTLNLQLQAGAQSAFLRPKSLRLASGQGRRLAVYGNSGCGKTRCITELAGEARPMHLYVVNPKSPAGAIIWDDFPEGLERTSLHVTSLAVRMIAGHRGPRVILALDPEYIEKAGVDRMKRLGIKTVQVLYSQQDMKKCCPGQPPGRFQER